MNLREKTRLLMPTYKLLTVKTAAALMGCAEAKAREALKAGEAEGVFVQQRSRIGQQSIWHSKHRKIGGPRSLISSYAPLAFCVAHPGGFRRLPHDAARPLFRPSESRTLSQLHGENPFVVGALNGRPFLFTVEPQVRPGPRALLKRLIEKAQELAAAPTEAVGKLARDRAVGIVAVVANDETRDHLVASVEAQALAGRMPLLLHVQPELELVIGSSA